MSLKTLLVRTAAMVVFSSCSLAAAQLAPTASLPDELAAQYKISKLNADSTGTVVTDAGTVLNLQKGGILGFQYDTYGIVAIKYDKSGIHSPNALALMMLNKTNKVQTKFLTVGEKVYVTKIDVNVKNEKITFSLVECDTCNNVQQPSGYKAQLAFQFDKGYLETANASQVEDTVGQVLTIDTSSGSDSQQAANAQGGGQGQQQAAPAPAPEPAAAPVSIEVGQTTDQVKAALGDPQKIVKLGTKQIYVYKDLKITFTNGKVSDVQ